MKEKNKNSSKPEEKDQGLKIIDAEEIQSQVSV